MKNTLLLIALLAATVSVKAQSKKPMVAIQAIGNDKHPNHLDSVRLNVARDNPIQNGKNLVNSDTSTQYFKDDNPISKSGSGSIFAQQIGKFTIQGSIPPASVIITGTTGKDIVLQFKKDGKDVGLSPDWDLITFKMDKKQVHWLNDSTAVFIRKQK